jgi:hypothetical protein
MPVWPAGEVAWAVAVIPAVPIGNPKLSSVPEVLVSISHCPTVGVGTFTLVGPLTVNVAVALVVAVAFVVVFVMKVTVNVTFREFPEVTQ